MSSAFEKAFAEVLNVEGGFSDHSDDRGGATKFGVTEMVARAYGYKGHMRDLPLATAKKIAKSQYWDTLRLDDVSKISAEIAREMFDTGYNMGIGRSARYFQRSLNVLNRQQRDYPDMVADGIIGPITLARFRDFVERRGKDGLLVLDTMLNALQGSDYVSIAENDQAAESFVYGWFKNRVT